MEQLLNSHGVRTMASGYVASTMMTASVYRMLRMNNAPEWLCQAANPKGAISGLVGGALDGEFKGAGKRSGNGTPGGNYDISTKTAKNTSKLPKIAIKTTGTRMTYPYCGMS